jgi:hypothetical protein
VTYEQGAELARQFNIPFFETSALNNTNVENVFMRLIADIKTRLEVESQDRVKMEVIRAKHLSSSPKSSNSCCHIM